MCKIPGRPRPGAIEGLGMSQWFPVSVGMRLVRVVLPWLFYVYSTVYKYTASMNARVIGKGLVLVGVNEDTF